MTMDKPDIDAMEAAANAATPGVWQKNGVRLKWRHAYSAQLLDSHTVGPDGDGVALVFYRPDHHAEDYGNARHIATSNPAAVLALIAYARRLEEALKRIEAAPAWGAPERWETTPAEVRQLARTALEPSR
jgi:hypothetical protein